jgi:pimeloyl-ACP methyl ester carboxylesterase
MWLSSPSWNATSLSRIKCPVWTATGDHDAAIQRNQADAIAAWTPFAGQLILPHTGHWGLLQDWKFLNFALEYFLDMEFDGNKPLY